MGRPPKFLVSEKAERLAADQLIDVETRSVERFLKEHPEKIQEAKQMLAQRLLALADAAHAQAKAKLKNETAYRAMAIAGVAAQRALDLLGQTPQPTLNLQVVIQSMQELQRVEKQIHELEVVNVSEPK
jgi:aconitase B